MKLARHTAIELAGILAGIKINRIEDKDAKAALLKDYLALRKVAKEAEADKDEIIRKFQEDWKDEIPAIEQYRKDGKQVVGHLDYLDAERDAGKAIQDLLKAEVDIDITAVPTDDIMAVSEDITLGQIAMLQEYGIIE